MFCLFYQEGVVNMPTSSEGFFNLGLLQREMGGASAERCYMGAVRLLPSSARFRYSFGNLLYDRNRCASATRKRACAFDPCLRAPPPLNHTRYTKPYPKPATLNNTLNPLH